MCRTRRNRSNCPRSRFFLRQEESREHRRTTLATHKLRRPRLPCILTQSTCSSRMGPSQRNCRGPRCLRIAWSNGVGIKRGALPLRASASAYLRRRTGCCCLAGCSAETRMPARRRTQTLASCGHAVTALQNGASGTPPAGAHADAAVTDRFRIRSRPERHRLDGRFPARGAARGSICIGSPHVRHVREPAAVASALHSL